MALSKCNNCEVLSEGYNSIIIQMIKNTGISKYKYVEQLLFGDFLARGIHLKNDDMILIAKSVLDSMGPLKQILIPTVYFVDKKRLLHAKNVYFFGRPEWNARMVKNYVEICKEVGCDNVKFDLITEDLKLLDKEDGFEKSFECPAKLFLSTDWSHPAAYADYYGLFAKLSSNRVIVNLQKMFPKGFSIYIKIVPEKKIDNRNQLNYLTEGDTLKNCVEKFKPVNFSANFLEADDFDREKDCFGIV